MTNKLTVTINPKKIGLFLCLGASLLIVGHIIGLSLWYSDYTVEDDWYWISILDLDQEESIGTWFSTLILFIASQLLIISSLLSKQKLSKYWVHWLILGVGFLLLSMDEVAGFHELINTITTETHWTIYGAIIATIIGLAFLPFLWHLPNPVRWIFIISGLLYIGGAVGVEWATIWYEDNDLLDTLAYNLWNAVEEGLEMLGIILFISSLLHHLNSKPSTEITFLYN